MLPTQRINDCWIRLREEISPQAWKQALADSSGHLALPEIDARALKGLKFAEALPARLAEATLALRFSDCAGRAGCAGGGGTVRVPAGLLTALNGLWGRPE
ncbi:hypothetical protein [Streptomyces sp. NPDC002785]|uniref:hypothetical protein n=1 Tax=Streptomyces sp. NPDC002785 TaxID=3154543 RepID=UPI0033313645